MQILDVIWLLYLLFNTLKINYIVSVGKSKVFSFSLILLFFFYSSCSNWMLLKYTYNIPNN